MASKRKNQQEDAKFRVMQLINQNPKLTSREIASKIGISNGSAYYLLLSLIDKGYVKLENLKNNSQKLRYSYLLTPKGIYEKSMLTRKFLARKKIEYEALIEEINQLEQDID
tara:strand:+ start:1334 stop:1669 length:336 start_codon:yes stop_codon:yes gene_type:complete